MRCGMCGVEARRGERMVGIAGFGICQTCVTLASDLHAGRETAVPVPRRVGWYPSWGWPDPQALADAEPAAVTAEVEVLRELIAPIERYLRGAEAALAGGTVEEIAVALGRHIHRTNVVLPDGTTVTAVSFVEDDAYSRDRAPDFGLYLDPRWAPPWEHEHLDWPDFDIPADKDAALDRLKLLLERARQGQLVEIGCLGAHGRTGTALACLAVLTGHPANDAVRWVRDNYCADAVETLEQREFVAQLDD